MINLDIYCTTGHYFNVLDKLPSYIKPLGLGDNNYPDHWLNEKNGKNISNLNKLDILIIKKNSIFIIKQF